MNNITVFSDFSKTKDPRYTNLDAVVESIRNPRQQTREAIDKAREGDAEAKKSLPCICFSGKFPERLDSAITEHSGLAVIDFDKLPSAETIKDKLKLLPYITVAFISPSGNGVKAVAKIPRSIQHHRKNYEFLVDKVRSDLNIPDKYLDKTSKNESRICYGSYDLDCYYNPNAKTLIPPQDKTTIETDYSKLDIAVKMIRLAHDGEKHHILLKAARLMGGYISGGVLDETIARQVLLSEISNRNIEDVEQAKRTIEDGLKYGKAAPLYETEEIESGALLQQLKVKYKSIGRKYEFLVNNEEDRADIQRYRDGGFEMGKPTGHKDLDKHFLFKEGEFNVLLGHANTGKSFFMWWLMALSALSLGWRWIVYSTENKTRQIKKKLVEFYTNKPIHELSDSEYEEALDWVDEMFAFIRIDKSYTGFEILDFAKVLMDEKEYKGFLIDPYNSLSIDKSKFKEVGNSRHEYDYELASEYVSFCDRRNVSIYLNAHAVSEALRKKHAQGHEFSGHPMPPEAADIEGGGKFVNRVTGFFMVVHRYIYHESEWRFTRVEIKKVKDVETGGRPTKYEEPVEFKMNGNLTEFTERHSNFNPMFPNENTEVPIGD